MRSLFFDTETTGMWSFREPDFGAAQPGLCQLGAILYEDRKIVAEVNLIVEPLTIHGTRAIIGADTSAIHGITNEMVESVGVPYKVALPMFNQLLKRADRVIAFNTSFDWKVMRCAYNRIAASQDALNEAEWLCAMLSSAPAVGKPGKYGDAYGWPKLQEAYKALVNPDGFDGAHNAMADVRATAEVVFALEDRGDPILPKGK